MRAEDWFFSACPIPFPRDGSWRVWVQNAADADTYVCRIDRGWFDESVKDIRLADIDTYERFSGTAAHRAQGAAGWQFARAQFVGRWGKLYSRMDTEKYGRILGTLHVRGDDGALHDVSALMRTLGFEKPAGTR